MSEPERVPALVIGAGPAGLMAAEALSAAGHFVVVAEAMPTPARKFLMAGKSGLNLTREEPVSAFTARITAQGGPLQPDFQAIVREFGPPEVQRWASDLGISLFTGSTGRVFPVGMKASPLLRAWLGRLTSGRVSLRPRWRWTGFDGTAMRFSTPEGERIVAADATVLALGGASWPRLGSDAAWVPSLTAAGVELSTFRPANMGLLVDWSPEMAKHFGAAVKGTRLTAGSMASRGEWVITRRGAEGGGIYEISASLREGTPAHIDLVAGMKLADMTSRLSKPRGKLSVGNWLRRALGDPVKVALLMEWGRPMPSDAAVLASLIKHLPIHHSGMAGLDRAISAAGGITLSSLTPDLELRALPNVFAAGEMLDWEAPTGGYLLTACLATGRHAGLAAAERLTQAQSALR